MVVWARSIGSRAAFAAMIPSIRSMRIPHRLNCLSLFPSGVVPFSAANTKVPNAAHGVRFMAINGQGMWRMDPVPEEMKSSMLVSSFKEELKRRQRVATTYFEHPVKNLQGEVRHEVFG
jgi:hypothetical protein